MSKRKDTLSLQQALIKAEADLRLEGCPNPKWGQDIFQRVKNGNISLDKAGNEIRQYVASRFASR
jgi:hypothetical protein